MYIILKEVIKIVEELNFIVGVFNIYNLEMFFVMLGVVKEMGLLIII